MEVGDENKQSDMTEPSGTHILYTCKIHTWLYVYTPYCVVLRVQSKRLRMDLPPYLLLSPNAVRYSVIPDTVWNLSLAGSVPAI